MADQLATELLERYSDLKSERDTKFASNWQYISQYFLPEDSNILAQKTEGVAGWTQNIYDTTAIECGQTLKTGQYNWLTPPGQVWGQYTVPEHLKGGEGEDDAKKWLGEASELIHAERARSNFYSIIDQAFHGVGVFATDLIFAEEGKKTLFNYRHARIGTYCIEEDDEGVVDTTFREFELTYRQATQMFNKPGDTIPKKMSDAARGPSGLRKKFKFLHCIFPREDSKRLPNRKDGPNKPIASVTISLEHSECVRISGYEEQPAMCQRFAKWGTDSPWGYGPAYLTLPIARQLNYVQQFLDALAELHAYPRVLVPDSLEGDVDLRAGGATIVNSAEGAAKPEEWATVGDYKLGLEMQEQRRNQMRESFMTKAFKLLNTEPLLAKEMTAYEISQRLAEQLGDFTPSLGRRITELMNPLMLREFGIAFRAGKLGTPPDCLMVDAGGGKKGLAMPGVLISNRLTDALKALKNRSREQTMQFLLPQVEAGRPELLDFLNDDFTRNYILDSGVPADELRKMKGPDSVAYIRQQRAQAQQAANAAQMAETMGKAGAGLGKSPDFLQQQAKESLAGKNKAA